MAKLTRKQIQEGLDYIPMDTLLLGVATKGQTSLTPKQREFARMVALGDTQAGAYRKAYGAKGKPKTIGDNASRLASDDRVKAEIEAYRLAAEAEKQRTPAQLRSLVIHQLTKHALDEACPPAQRIKALELLGKVSEVAAFTERKETMVTHQSSAIKQKLLDQLRNVVDITPNTKNDADDSADSLLAELQAIPGAGEIFEDGLEQTHPPGTPVDEDGHGQEYTHTIPHTQIHSKSDPSVPHEQFPSDSVGAKSNFGDVGVEEIDPSPLSNGDSDATLLYSGEDKLTPTLSDGEDPPASLDDEIGEGGSFNSYNVGVRK